MRPDELEQLEATKKKYEKMLNEALEQAKKRIMIEDK